jgi:hypothetical protein
MNPWSDQPCQAPQALAVHLGFGADLQSSSPLRQASPRYTHSNLLHATASNLLACFQHVDHGEPALVKDLRALVIEMLSSRVDDFGDDFVGLCESGGLFEERLSMVVSSFNGDKLLLDGGLLVQLEVRRHARYFCQ